ncbi:MAG: Gfo/Idh/MocA family oxidoreductase [Phycisphaeraceae bacterium]
MPTRLGFVGAGYMGQLAHIDKYCKLPDVTLAALAEQRPQLAARVGQAYGFERTYPDHRAMLDAGKLDAVVAIAPFQLNAPLVADVLEAGLPVITEKPQTTTSQRGRELIDLARQKNLVYQVGYMKRFDPGVRWAKAQIARWRDTGDVGPMLSLRAWCAHGQWQWFRDPPIRTDEKVPESTLEREPRHDWMTTDQWRGHVAWINYYSHQTNLARYLAGEDYTLDSVRRREHDDVVSTYIQGTFSDSAAHLYFDFTGHTSPDWDEGVEVRFARATLRVDLAAPLAINQAARVRVVSVPSKGEPTELRPRVEQRDGFAMQARQFVASVRGDEPPLSPAHDAIKEVDLSEQIIAMLQQQPVTS